MPHPAPYARRGPAAWLESLRAAPLADVAAAAGLQGDARHGLGPCLACNAERRGGSDSRGPVGMTANGAGWRCQRCKAGGDAVALAALAATGQLRPAEWSAVREWAAARGWGDGDRGLRLASMRGKPGEGAGRVAGAADQLDVVQAVPGRRRQPLHGGVSGPRDGGTPHPAPQRPPAAEIAQVWADALPLTHDRSRLAARWVAGRGLDPEALELLDLARVLAPSARLPGWAGTARATWAASGHLLVAPLWGAATGEMESLRARAVVADPWKKALAPRGASVAGLVLACPLARLLLAGALLGDDATPAADEVRRVGLVVAEGEPDAWTWATAGGAGDGCGGRPAVLGMVSGGWSEAVAARVPDGARVVVRTHHADKDGTGDRYAVAVARSLGRRCQVLRGAAPVAPVAGSGV